MRRFTLLSSVAAPVVVAALLLAGCGGSGNSQSASDLARPADPVQGRELFQQNCSSCHGGLAQGLPHAGANLRKSQFLATNSDENILAFVKSGRLSADPKNKSGVQMPPRGGNRYLEDPAILDIIAHLRNVQQQAKLDPPLDPPSDEEEAQASNQ